MNEMVVAGNCPRWLMTSGPVVLEKRVIALRGTCPTAPVVTGVATEGPIEDPAGVMAAAVVVFGIAVVNGVAGAVGTVVVEVAARVGM